MFSESTIYIVGMARSPQNNPITYRYGFFLIGFVVDREAGEIIQCESSFALATTNEFVRSIFIGKKITIPIEEIRRIIEERYLGRSQKTILAAYKDAQEKFICHKNGIKIDFSR